MLSKLRILVLTRSTMKQRVLKHRGLVVVFEGTLQQLILVKVQFLE